ncbi:MAG: hypothetical protein DMF85_07625 [Acidobacteria bacterium]|nr:MAG: hypothetical protein DMF85_07625 [Acidobacteriota bacterium]
MAPSGISTGRTFGGGPSFSGVGKSAGLIAIQVFTGFPSGYPSCDGSPCVLSYPSNQIAALQRVQALAGSFHIASVNMSLGGGRYFLQSTCDTANAAVKTAIDNLRSIGIATVIASGNDGFTGSMGAPGCISSAVSVGSVDDGSFSTTANAVSNFSNSASFLNLLAPGRWITSSIANNVAPYNVEPYLSSPYSTWSGTSMATPHVAGAWALMKQRKPLASVHEAAHQRDERDQCDPRGLHGHRHTGAGDHPGAAILDRRVGAEHVRAPAVERRREPRRCVRGAERRRSGDVPWIGDVLHRATRRRHVLRRGAVHQLRVELHRARPPAGHLQPDGVRAQHVQRDVQSGQRREQHQRARRPAHVARCAGDRLDHHGTLRPGRMGDRSRRGGGDGRGHDPRVRVSESRLGHAADLHRRRELRRVTCGRRRGLRRAVHQQRIQPDADPRQPAAGPVPARRVPAQHRDGRIHDTGDRVGDGERAEPVHRRPGQPVASGRVVHARGLVDRSRRADGHRRRRDPRVDLSESRIGDTADLRRCGNVRHRAAGRGRVLRGALRQLRLRTVDRSVGGRHVSTRRLRAQHHHRHVRDRANRRCDRAVDGWRMAETVNAKCLMLNAEASPSRRREFFRHLALSIWH